MKAFEKFENAVFFKIFKIPSDSNNFATISDTCAHFTQELY